MPQETDLTLKNELAEKELIKQFRHDNTWLSQVRSKQSWVGNEVIKIPTRGVAPAVLINNEIYPIAKKQRKDNHVVVSLNRYDTENTVVSDEELYGLPYEKVSDIQLQHREELEDKTAEHALHSIAPQAASTAVPVLQTTGGDDGTGRRRLSSGDLIEFKKALDKRDVPKAGHILVLCADHVADLLEEDRKFFAQYQNPKDGMLSSSYYGFGVYESNYTPFYSSEQKKIPFDAPDSKGHSASIVFHKKCVVKARGSVMRYTLDASQNPEYRESTIGFRLYFVCVAIKDVGQGAIISGPLTAPSKKA